MKLRIATPMYDASCRTRYHNSIIELQQLLAKGGVQCSIDTLSSESLIPRARNKMARKFMDHDETHVLFWDADLGVEVDGLWKMLGYGEQPQYEIVGGLYPTKKFDWEAIKLAVIANPSIDPKQLELAGSVYVYNQLAQSKSRIDAPVEVNDVGTGLMLIQRGVFEKLQVAYPDMWYEAIDGDVGYDGANPDTKMWSYFESGIDYRKLAYGKQAYLSEDFAFCARARAAGIKVWMAPWLKTTHTGVYEWRGDFATSYKAKAAVSKALLLKDAVKIGGWMSVAELQWLAIQALSHRNIIEIGSYKGRSTRALADNTKGMVYAFDRWQPYDEPGHNHTAQEMKSAELEFVFNLQDHLASKKVRVNPNIVIDPDMVFIDADHSYEGVKQDILRWQGRIVKGGLLCGHDYEPGWPGLMKAVDELVPNRSVVPGTTIWWATL